VRWEQSDAVQSRALSLRSCLELPSRLCPNVGTVPRPGRLVVLLDPADIVGNLHQAYRYPGFSSARYAVLMSGPSATADIEGVLILGAQGVRTLTVIPVPR
jgi:hypothetical protein